MFESGEVCAEQGAPMTHCRTCGAALDPDWCDVYCPPCLEQVYEDLAKALLRAFLSGYRGALLQRRMPTGERRWWARLPDAG